MLLWDNRDQTDRALYRWWALTFAICTVVCCYFVVIGNGHKSKLNTLLRTGQERLIELQNEIDQSISSGDGAAQQRVAASETIDSLRQGQWSGMLLQKLTQQIPEHAWLTELVFDGEEVRISGTTSTDAIEVVTNLEAANWVSNVTLLRPFRTDNRTNQSSFDLLLIIDLGAL
jgi:Tfp pilus assembly protein PilN